jgi:hypothetical protein
MEPDMLIMTINGLVANSDDYTLLVEGNYQTPNAFPGSGEGVLVKLGFSRYKVSQTPNNNLIRQYSHITYEEGCSGVIHPDETKT